MSKGIETVRELNAAELDRIGGGLSVGLGVTADVLNEFEAAHGAIGGALDRLGLASGPGGVVATALGAVGGALGKV